MKAHNGTLNVDYKGVELIVGYEYSPAYFSNDYLCPNEPEEAEITSVMIGDADALSLLEDKLTEIEELVIEELNN